MQATPIGPPSLTHQPLLPDTHTHIREKKWNRADQLFANLIDLHSAKPLQKLLTHTSAHKKYCNKLGIANE